MKINPLEFILCRIPAFGITDVLENKWAALKSKIKESSLAFYETIEHLEAQDIDKLPEKTRFTLWKYFNRAKYRSTPFGSFASVVAVPMAKEATHPIQVGREIYSHHFIDWSHKEETTKPVKKAFKNSKFFLSNSSIYSIGEELRYISFKNLDFELAAVARIPELEALLSHCRNPAPLNALHELMQANFEMDKASTNQLLLQMMELQLVHTDAFPNITGEDYFTRIGQKASGLPSDYIISERKLLNGSFSQQYLKQLPELVDFLAQNLQSPINCDLNDFKEAFLRKFEQREVSLAVAMDPEIGIGYSKLEQQNLQDKLVVSIKSGRQGKTGGAQLDYGPLQQFLLNQMMTGQAINLEEFKGNTSANRLSLPNTFSLIFHLYKHHPVITQMGNCTANALLGRFTVANQEIEANCKKIAQLEKEANPDVLFFDIAYQAEQRSDNVNRRKSLYEHELPILTWPSSKQPLDFNDILISICGQEIVLRSKRLNKRLIPRLPSAYNYSRSDLSAYRFLCDLQYQNLHFNLGFKLQNYFPHLSHYPRVHFKDIVVSPASWLVPNELFKEKEAKEALKKLRDWLTKNQVDAVFKAGHADHILCFDPASDEDLQAFILYGKQCCEQEIYISEGLIDESSCISDEDGTQHLSQYIANYCHKEPVYRPYANIGRSYLVQSQKPVLELPGGDWIYVELYLHPSRSNAVLQYVIKPFLKAHHKKIKKWFFIRYNDPSAHIRFRIHLNNKVDGYYLLDAFKQLIYSDVQLGLIQDFKVRTYYKEIERYGASKIDGVEQFFCADSQYALHLLGRAGSHEQLYQATLSLVEALCKEALPSVGEQLQFVKQVAQSFAQEMGIEHDHFKRINSEFNEFRKKSDGFSLHMPKNVLQPLFRQFQLLLLQCKDEAEKKRLLSDLIHMHINRLFISDQRVHETIIYHYLLRALQTKRALAALPAE